MKVDTNKYLVRLQNKISKNEDLKLTSHQFNV